MPCSNARPTHACHQPRSQSQRCLRAANGSPLRLCTAGLRPAFLILRGTARRRSRSFRGAVPERPPSTTRHQPPHRPDRRFCFLGGRSFSSDINLTRAKRAPSPERSEAPSVAHAPTHATAGARHAVPERPPSTRLPSTAPCSVAHAPIAPHRYALPPAVILKASDQDARPEGSLRSFARACATTTPRPHKLPLHRHPRRHHSCYI